MGSSGCVGMRVNDQIHRLDAADDEILLNSLRELGYTEIKKGCEKGDCGACAVLIDGVAVDTCLVFTKTCESTSIITSLGLVEKPLGKQLANAFVTHGAAQCGYCTPGLLVASYSLLNSVNEPDETDIYTALTGNLCRCTGYQRVVGAVHSVVEKNFDDMDCHE